jgi:serine O-acetyltransferase
VGQHSFGLISLIEQRVLAHDSLAAGLSNSLGSKLGGGIDFGRMCEAAYAADPDIVEAAACDLKRTLDLDPAADGFLRIYLFFKGFFCVQCARVAHHFWNLPGKQSRILALALQSEMADRFDVDIHPAARWGRGITMDHAGCALRGRSRTLATRSGVRCCRAAPLTAREPAAPALCTAGASSARRR